MKTADHYLDKYVGLEKLEKHIPHYMHFLRLMIEEIIKESQGNKKNHALDFMDWANKHGDLESQYPDLYDTFTKQQQS